VGDGVWGGVGWGDGVELGVGGWGELEGGGGARGGGGGGGGWGGGGGGGAGGRVGSRDAA
jgi:hypothetical protein